jgi:hypothetical protein
MLDCPVSVPSVKNEKQESSQLCNFKTKPQGQYFNNVHCKTKEEILEIYQECSLFASHKPLTYFIYE